MTQLDAGVLDAELQTMLASSVLAAANSLHVRARGCVSGCVRVDWWLLTAIAHRIRTLRVTATAPRSTPL